MIEQYITDLVEFFTDECFTICGIIEPIIENNTAKFSEKATQILKRQEEPDYIFKYIFIKQTQIDEDYYQGTILIPIDDKKFIHCEY